jgi:hypothetical protein
MVLRGHVQNGMVMFDEPVVLPEGAVVKVELVEENVATQPKSAADQKAPIEKQLAAIWADLPSSEWAKLPPDLSDNLDHHIYGAPKK